MYGVCGVCVFVVGEGLGRGLYVPAPYKKHRQRSANNVSGISMVQPLLKSRWAWCVVGLFGDCDDTQKLNG